MRVVGQKSRTRFHLFWLQPRFRFQVKGLLPVHFFCKHCHVDLVAKLHFFKTSHFYRPQGKGNVVTVVCLSTIGLTATLSLLGFKVRSVRILLECFLVDLNALDLYGTKGRSFHLNCS